MPPFSFSLGGYSTARANTTSTMTNNHFVSRLESVIANEVLHEAAYSGTVEILTMLADAGADIHDRGNTWESSPLHGVAKYGHEPALRRLLLRGAEVHVLNGKGETPLHSAARHGYLDVATTLIEHGADVNAADDGG